MNRAITKSEQFLADFDLQPRWYFQKASEDLAGRYLLAVDSALKKVAQHPDLGRVRHFPQPALRGIRSFSVEPPFDVHLVFYRFDESHLNAWRIMHGARDLPNCLTEPVS